MSLISEINRLAKDDSIQEFEALFEWLEASKREDWNQGWQADLLTKSLADGQYKCADFIAGKGYINHRNSEGKYPAHGLYINPDAKMIAVMVTHGWDVNQVIEDKLQNTLLHQLARMAGESELRGLVRLGADIDSKNRHGETPLAVAQRFCNEKGISYLQSAGKDTLVKKRDCEAPVGREGDKVESEQIEMFP